METLMVGFTKVIQRGCQMNKDYNFFFCNLGFVTTAEEKSKLNI